MYKPKVIFTIANNSTVPYFTNFMKLASEKGDIDYIFIALTTPEPAKMVQEAESYGLKGYWVKYDTNRKKIDLLKAIVLLYKIFRKEKPDAVIGHLFEDSLCALMAARLAGIKIRGLVKQDTAYHYYFAKKGVFFDKLNNFNATHVISVSKECKDFVIEKENCPVNKIRVIHHGIELNRFLNYDHDEINNFKKDFGIHNHFVVGTVSRFIEWKGYKGILEIAEQLVHKIPGIKFIWLGYGAQKEYFKNKVKELNLEQYILIPDIIPHSKIHLLYQSMDIYLHNAFMEPFGFVIAEAMAAGVPVVSTPTGAARDAIEHKVNGWLGEYNNPRSLMEGIEYFYSLKVHRPFSPTQETAKRLFSFERMYEDYKKIYFEK